jgi:hypothetical protein
MNDRAVYEDRFRIDDPHARCIEFAAATAARLAAEPPKP